MDISVKVNLNMYQLCQGKSVPLVATHNCNEIASDIWAPPFLMSCNVLSLESVTMSLDVENERLPQTTKQGLKIPRPSLASLEKFYQHW